MQKPAEAEWYPLPVSDLRAGFLKSLDLLTLDPTQVIEAYLIGVYVAGDYDLAAQLLAEAHVFRQKYTIEETANVLRERRERLMSFRDENIDLQLPIFESPDQCSITTRAKAVWHNGRIGIIKQRYTLTRDAGRWLSVAPTRGQRDRTPLVCYGAVATVQSKLA